MKKISAIKSGPDKRRVREEEKKTQTSLIGSLIRKNFVEPSLFNAITHLNMFLAFVIAFALLAGFHLSPWFLLIYFPLLYMLDSIRKSQKEKDRLEIAHRIPFFTDALANALSVGSTLEQAFGQAAFYLRGKIKEELNKLVLKNALGEDLGTLLRELDAKFPHTGLVYLVSLLEAYNQLGVGISPLLKKISVMLGEKEKAEAKIRTTLAAGSGYARLSIIIFVIIFFGLAYVLKDQVKFLFSPELKPMLIFLSIWTSMGILVVTRMTSLDFARAAALRPYIKTFLEERKLELDDLMTYSIFEWTPQKKRMVLFGPLIVGVITAYLASLYTPDTLMIIVSFLAGILLSRFFIKFILQGIIEDELVRIVEIFPEILQIFNIGLNSGLNTYLAFDFAQKAIRSDAPKLLNEELCRTKFAMECGEDPARTWQLLAKRLPFESVVDFCDIMVVAPMHGESIVNSIAHMIDSYQEKKMAMIEKKANSLSQLVIPIIIAAFFPLFLFVVFAPMITKITGFFSS